MGGGGGGGRDGGGEGKLGGAFLDEIVRIQGQVLQLPEHPKFSPDNNT